METKVEDVTKMLIYSQYMGCECMIYEEGCEPFEDMIEGIDIMIRSVISERVNYRLSDGYEIKLLLRHLSDISDEHAIHVTRMIDEYGFTFDFLKKHVREYEYRVKRKEGVLYVERYHNNEKYHDFKFEVMSMGFTLTLAIKVTDYLRRNGYMIPYDGMDLFDIGLAVRIKK